MHSTLFQDVLDAIWVLYTINTLKAI